MRLAVALCGLVAMIIDEAELHGFILLTYATIILYSIYSATLYFLALRQTFKSSERLTPWIDAAVYCVLIGLSGGASSIFFLLFFFAIIEVSFRWGAKTARRMTNVSALLFAAIGLATAHSVLTFELNRFLMRIICLLVFGYMMAYWGGAEIKLKRQLKLLRDINTLSNPRFGVERTLRSLMEKLQLHYDADACVLLQYDRRINGYRLTRIARSKLEKEMRAEKVPTELVDQLLALPRELAVIYNRKLRIWKTGGLSYYAVDVVKNKRRSDGLHSSKMLAVALDAESFVSLPLFNKGQSEGRLYLTGPLGRFEQSDVEFLLQIIEQMAPALENIRLLNQLASGAAERERKKIARDLHDTVIQPYIGLQYKVAAIHNKLTIGKDVTRDVEKLLDMSLNETNGLREYVCELKDVDSHKEVFLAAVNRYVAQFQENYSIAVAVDSDPDLHVDDRLSAELIQMVHEGLSNVRKHTESLTSRISFKSYREHLVVTIQNESPVGMETISRPFTPISLTERAEALGGQVELEQRKEGYTIIRVSIPL
jgi:signal transduction histidine kinase